MHSHVLGLVDYIIFGLTLSISASVGVYFGCFGSKQKSASEYLYGSRNMKAIPVGLSLYSSAISAVTIVGFPAEVYVFGTQYMLVGLGAILSLFITWNLILPVFCGNLKISTPYEYFELRFNYAVRTLSSVIYIAHTLLYMPVVLYATTVSFSAVSQLPLVYCTTVVGGVCVFYTMLGGFKSVIWTDTIQATLMLCSCIFLMVMGIIKLGGFSRVWQRSDEGERIKFFNMDPNPFVRLSFWSATIGMLINFASHSGCSAGAIQRYMSLPNEKQARISTSIGVLGFTAISVVCGLIGLCMYVFYEFCDPVANKDISGSNVILSYYMGDIVGNITGFSGFFIAGILSAGLSTISAELNTVSGLLYHDFILKIFRKRQINETKGALLMKFIVLINGLFYLITAPLLAKATYLFQLSQVIAGFTYGAKLGLMILGTTFPKCNTAGALWGTLASLVLTGWITIGTMYSGASTSYALPTKTSNCTPTNVTDLFETTTLLSVENPVDAEPFFLYKLSYMYLTFLGTVITIVVGLAVSYITGTKEDHKVDPRLLIPRLRPSHHEMCCTDPRENKLFTELQVTKS